MIELDQLTCRKSGKLLLEKIQFSIKQGEYVLIVGPNGAGKTTLLHCIARLYDDWSGSIRIMGSDSRTLSRKELARRIAYVRQISEVPPYTVAQYVGLSRYPHLSLWSQASEEDRCCVEGALSRMALLDAASRRLETLSGGERQNAFLAAALAQETPILLLDEPTSFLDYRRQTENAARLRNINREFGRTIVEVSHDLNHALRQADHIIAICRGHLLYDGKAEGLLEPALLHEIFDVDFDLISLPEDPLPQLRVRESKI